MSPRKLAIAPTMNPYWYRLGSCTPTTTPKINGAIKAPTLNTI